MRESDDYLNSPLVRARLTPEEIRLAEEDESWLDEEIFERGKKVFSAGWDFSGWGAGSSGAIWVTEWRGLYFSRSSDYDPEGPYEDLESAAWHEALWELHEGHELSSTVMPEADLIARAASCYKGEIGETIEINGKTYEWTGTDLVPAPPPSWA